MHRVKHGYRSRSHSVKSYSQLAVFLPSLQRLDRSPCLSMQNLLRNCELRHEQSIGQGSHNFSLHDLSLLESSCNATAKDQMVFTCKLKLQGFSLLHTSGRPYV